MPDIPVFGSDQIDPNRGTFSVNAQNVNWDIPGQRRWGSQLDSTLQDFYNNAVNRSPVALSSQMQDQARLEQQRVIQELQRLAQGDMSQLNASYDQARGNVAGLGGMRRNSGAGATMRNVATQQAGMSAQQAGDAAVLKRQQELAAQQAMQQLYGQMRGQDVGFADADFQNQMQSQAMNDALAQMYAQMQGGQGKADQESALNQIRAQLGLDPLYKQLTDSYIGAGTGMLGTAFDMSSRMFPNNTPSAPPLVQANPYNENEWNGWDYNK